MVIQDISKAIGTLFIPSGKLSTLTGFMVSFFALVRYRTRLDVLSFLFIAVYMISALCVAVPLSLVLSSIYTLSKDFRHTLSSSTRLIEGRLVRKYFQYRLNSCTLIRCKVGNLYYMEAEAKLTMIDHTVNGIMLLLVNVK